MDDGVAYRWTVSPDSGYDVVIVQSAQGIGAKLLVTVDGSYGESHAGKAIPEATEGRAITPGLVVTIVRLARDQGWSPDVAGSDIYCRLGPNGAVTIPNPS